jgi:hypothetical protein
MRVFLPWGRSVIVAGLRAGDDVVQHIAVRSLANLLTTDSRGKFDPEEVEPLLAALGSDAVIESVGTCCAILWSERPPTCREFAERLCRSLLLRESSDGKIIGLIVGARSDSLKTVKDGIVGAFKGATGELRVKALLAICLVFRDSAGSFVELSPKFFATIEKVADNEVIFNALFQWSSGFLEDVIDAAPNCCRLFAKASK